MQRESAAEFSSVIFRGTSGLVAENFGDSVGEFRVNERQGNFGDAQGRPLGRAIENAVGHALGAKHLVALLAEHPGDRVDDVGLAAAIGADDASDPAAAEDDLRLFAEGFEAQQFDFTQFEHAAPRKSPGSSIDAGKRPAIL